MTHNEGDTAEDLPNVNAEIITNKKVKNQGKNFFSMKNFNFSLQVADRHKIFS